jgi:hypothetical protein
VHCAQLANKVEPTENIGPEPSGRHAIPILTSEDGTLSLHRASVTAVTTFVRTAGPELKAG